MLTVAPVLISNKIWRTTHDDGPEVSFSQSNSFAGVSLRAGVLCASHSLGPVNRTASHPADPSNGNKGMENGLKLRRETSGPTACATAERNDTTARSRGRVCFNTRLIVRSCRRHDKYRTTLVCFIQSFRKSPGHTRQSVGQYGILARSWVTDLRATCVSLSVQQRSTGGLMPLHG